MTALRVGTTPWKALWAQPSAIDERQGMFLGAGGGGIAMIVVPPECRMAVVTAPERVEETNNSCHFTKNGTQAWRI